MDHVIDNFWGAEECDPATVAQRSEKVLTIFRRNMKSLGIWDRITVHKSDSYAATAAFWFKPWPEPSSPSVWRGRL